MDAIRIGELEAAINRARSAAPAQGVEATLSPDVAVLADVYGRMIYQRVDALELSGLSEDEQAVLQRWRR